MNEPIGGDISHVECPQCDALMVYIEYKSPAYLDETELGFYCEQCEQSYESMIERRIKEKKNES